jgi:hypothetical protein
MKLYLFFLSAVAALGLLSGGAQYTRRELSGCSVFSPSLRDSRRRLYTGGGRLGA